MPSFTSLANAYFAAAYVLSIAPVLLSMAHHWHINCTTAELRSSGAIYSRTRSFKAWVWTIASKYFHRLYIWKL